MHAFLKHKRYISVRFWASIVFFSLILSCSHLYDAHAARMTDVRIGLEELYKNKSSIMIYNSSIALGFCVNDNYTSEIEIDSPTGFGFTPERSTFYEDKNNYTTYRKAVSICDTYRIGGAEAYPVYAGTGCWKCFVTAASYNNLATGNMKDLTGDFKKRNSSAYLIKLSWQNNTIIIDGASAGGFPQIKALNPTNGIYSVNLGTRSYRGRIEIGRYDDSSNLTAVNVLNIESYLLGVVTCEMNHTWPKEALKAQAVCSRSYAYVRSGFGADSRLKNPYSVGDTTASQVYRGINGERPEGIEAVNATVGEIVLSKGKPIDAFFFSTSGGATDSITDIWGIKSAAYKGVFDRFETDPEKKPWVVEFTTEEMSNKLAGAGYDVGNVKTIEPLILTGSGRIYRAKITGSKKTVTVSGVKLRSIFGLTDTKFRVITSSSNADIVSLKSDSQVVQERLKECYVITSAGIQKLSEYQKQYILITNGNFYNVPASVPEKGIFRIIGMGWGHGVGMSQSGAMGMARKGYNYKQIIDFYYNNAEVGNY